MFYCFNIIYRIKKCLFIKTSPFSFCRSRSSLINSQIAFNVCIIGKKIGHRNFIFDMVSRNRILKIPITKRGKIRCSDSIFIFNYATFLYVWKCNFFIAIVFSNFFSKLSVAFQLGFFYFVTNQIICHCIIKRNLD
ncbi:hypothetical protein D9M72_453610 [compost metagenome]